jgi:hypothetical protein
VQAIIYESSITGLFRFILILFFVYIGYTLLIRYIIPLLLKSTMRNFQQKFHDENPQFRNPQPKKEGEVTIEYVEEKSKNQKAQSEDDYVDYEEVK